jgi:hypothetical protein
LTHGFFVDRLTRKSAETSRFADLQINGAKSGLVSGDVEFTQTEAMALGA